jgi:circadian clock protein KaiC
LSSIERMPTGIPGLDEMIEGGLPVPSLILLAGDAGAGKTTFCIQFLCSGADQGEPGLYFLTYGGPVDSLFKFVSTYDFVKKTYLGREICWVELEDKVERAGKAEDVLNAIQEEIEKLGPKRIVIENLSDLKEGLKGDYRRFLLKLSHLIKAQKAVALVTGDALPRMPYPTEIAHVADGIILLQNEEINLARRRSIEILKMCGTSHHLGKHALDISVKGLTVYPGL